MYIRNVFQFENNKAFVAVVPTTLNASLVQKCDRAKIEWLNHEIQWSPATHLYVPVFPESSKRRRHQQVTSTGFYVSQALPYVCIWEVDEHVSRQYQVEFRKLILKCVCCVERNVRKLVAVISNQLFNNIGSAIEDPAKINLTHPVVVSARQVKH